MKPILLRNATCVTLSPLVLERADVRVVGGVITERGPRLLPTEGESVEDLAGKLLTPGLVCAHTHLYSSLSRGMPGPDRHPKNFLEILQNIWWKLDRSLDAETIYYSALAGALEAARCGVTTVIDHHASPNAISGSLLNVQKGLAAVGLRGILCYETSDRDGPERRDEGLAENTGFLETHRSDEMYRGVVGGHASFTLSDESLRAIGDIADRFDTGAHLHLAEADTDPQVTEATYGRRILDRFEESGILRRKSLFAHCVHLHAQEFEKLRTCGCWLVHNPRSNMNNGVGHAPVEQFGERKSLGTDGFPPDMFEEARTAYFRNRESGKGTPAEALCFLTNGLKIASEQFGRPFGLMQKDAPADLIVVNYAPPTPVTDENFPAHLLFGFRSSMVESVLVDGRWIIHHGQFPHLREEELLRGAQAAAQKLWSAMHALRS
jgi:putative selenium metabolism protein SsnA